eukprot:COSAG06_NODE_3291_length_5547_cov_263.463656_8_plen_112_part_00
MWASSALDRCSGVRWTCGAIRAAASITDRSVGAAPDINCGCVSVGRVCWGLLSAACGLRSADVFYAAIIGIGLAAQALHVGDEPQQAKSCPATSPVRSGWLLLRLRATGWR